MLKPLKEFIGRCRAFDDKIGRQDWFPYVFAGLKWTLILILALLASVGVMELHAHYKLSLPGQELPEIGKHSMDLVAFVAHHRGVLDLYWRMLGFALVLLWVPTIVSFVAYLRYRAKARRGREAFAAYVKHRGKSPKKGQTSF